MLFNSYEFILVFLPTVFWIYFYLNSKKLITASKGFLLFSSLFFYSWWNIAYLPILLGSILFNYILGVSISKRTNIKILKRVLLIIGILTNLLLLGYFKYTDFLIENFNFVVNGNIETLDLLLPLAISFFTFQQIAYLVDSYNGETKEYDFLNYAIFVSFFPQLIAGPIVHHKEMMPQFLKLKNKIKNYRNISLGIFIFSIGLFKKVVIADTFSTYATPGFDVADTLSFIEAWTTSLSYTFQLYFDFSGYTDMAIGIALLFNIKLPINFNSPYKSVNIQDFWRRWHITLSRFMRDYIYIPLGGSRNGQVKMYSNLMATFVIGGLWHGAGWTFIIWGGAHGIALMVHRVWQKIGIKMHSFIAWVITFNFINMTWVFFRARELDDAIKVLKGMFGLSGFTLHLFLEEKLGFLNNYGVEFKQWIYFLDPKQGALLILTGFLIVLFGRNSMYFQNNFKPNKMYLILNVFLLITPLFFMARVSEFLYFNF
jgi:alginate O-acetyltransferase complex protein AlgI